MNDSNDYLSKLEEMRKVNQTAMTEKERQNKKNYNESVRRKKFKEALKIYRERGARIDQGCYFLGTCPRRSLEYEDAVELFGRDYVDQHVKEDPNFHGFVKWDQEGDRKVTKEEIGKFRGKIQSIAYNLMQVDPPNYFMVGAKLYAKLGKGRKIIPKLLKKVEEYKREGGILSDRDFLYIKMFIKKNSKGREPGQGTLEGRTMVFFASIFVGIVLSSYSLTATGNAIGNLTETSQGLLGLFLFILGLFGFFFNRNKK